ncbi:MAG TPA: hypothetical protein VFI15_11950 [Candidatus Limnocylindrales bacterium]|nr:hypothetical protein [Candidatus Limnocylindrales bacterium]
MRASWPGSMQSALAATLTTPEWWAMALAAFLVRGGIFLILVPIIALPTPAALITDLSPVVERVVLGTPTLAGAIVGAASISLVVLVAAWAGVVGAWIDAALTREAASSDELDLAWSPGGLSSWRAFGIRITAHIPTLLAIGYAIVRIATISYTELTAPDEPGVPVVERVLGQVPDALALVVIAWLLGEAVGALAVRRVSAGMSETAALLVSVRQLLSPRGLATLVATTIVLLAVALPFALAAQRAWEHVRGYLLFGVDAMQLTAAIVVLVATWVLGLAIVGAALAWRATAWTAEVTTR